MGTVVIVWQVLSIQLTNALILPAFRLCIRLARTGRRVEVAAGGAGLWVGQLIVADIVLATIARLGQVSATDLVSADVSGLQKDCKGK